MDSGLCRLAADAYAEKPAGRAIDWRDMRAVVNGNIAAVRGTDPDSLYNWERDFSVWQEHVTQHPQLGRCAAGALEAAEALAPLIPPEVDTLTGHSLGGQVAVILAALLLPQVKLLVTFDAPKAGGFGLAATLDPVAVRQYKFRGSVVTEWPLCLDIHVRPPLINIGDWTLSPLRAHSIERAALWLDTH